MVAPSQGEAPWQMLSPRNPDSRGFINDGVGWFQRERMTEGHPVVATIHLQSNAELSRARAQLSHFIPLPTPLHFVDSQDRFKSPEEDKPLHAGTFDE